MTTEPRPISEAKKDGTVIFGLGKDDAWPQPMRWLTYDEATAEEIGEDGYWSYAEDLIGDVAGDANPVVFWPMFEWTKEQLGR
ncbi:hypothetical protein [Ancylobacter rudongensis]|uniref:Uncharacterized protein n=1 Tax=Ancylobacter rudongensis TaxID=177413 RepID=A0A1G4UST6_9HYPH|nr:hypothetical protein [Ancylobacter rudongensis]SCW95849.1 hypothetical protein SAMN05660859_0132 [Ancylobacter rudongensis]